MDFVAFLDTFGLVSNVLSLLAGIAVVALGPRRLVTYLLGGLLAFFFVRDGLSQADAWIVDDVWAYNAAVLWIGMIYSFAFLQLAFIARAVDTPLTRPLRTRAASLAFVLGTILVFVLPFVFHASVVARGPDADEPWIPAPVVALVSPFTYILPAAYSLAAAIDAYRRAPLGSLTRRRARAYLTAFLTWDVGMLLGSAYYLLWRAYGEGTPAMNALGLAYGTLFLAFPFLLARALLRDQLFDFDLKVKWTIRRGTLVAVFVAVFFVAGAIAEQWLQQYGVVVGGAAVGLLLFALRPLERAADRLANAAMPGVEATPAYVAFRKVEVYKATVEDLASDGGISDADRRVLDALRRKLGLTEEDARAVERDVVPAA